MPSLFNILKDKLPTLFSTTTDTDQRSLIQKSKDWFSSLSRRVTGQKRFKPLVQVGDLDDPIRKINYLVPGTMVHFVYSAKWKDVLPYWDKFPLIFPVSFYGDGFLGINFHYLRPEHRAILLDALLKTINNKRYDETTKIKINYSILKSAANSKYYAPCIKRYLYYHVRSSYIQIDANEWATAIWLPTAKFAKKSQSYVWNQSLKATKKVK